MNRQHVNYLVDEIEASALGAGGDRVSFYSDKLLHIGKVYMVWIWVSLSKGKIARYLVKVDHVACVYRLSAFMPVEFSYKAFLIGKELGSKEW